MDATPTTDTQRARRARQVLEVKPSGKWDNPRPFGYGRHTRRFRNPATGELLLVHGTRTHPWDRAAASKRRRRAARIARRANR